MRQFSTVFSENYRTDIQLSRHQAAIIGQTIWCSGPGSNVLVFGLGNDSLLWNKLNAHGRTVFVENNKTWAKDMRERWPELEIERVSYGKSTVESSLPIDEKALIEHPIPGFMRDIKWDVILIDGPMGFRSTSPGRALPIYWSYVTARECTHIFIDDCNRRLEGEYTAKFFPGTERVVVNVPRVMKLGKPSKEWMSWVVGGEVNRSGFGGGSNF
ncbi:hypothetical protein RUR49_14875 [Pseudoxanthobacter sp. M-2]|uniref:hypothetical protein n=1 Tax=Pseudoxanthobacter sp. M-2 TaxID=3078754 RepID=UPI0038FC073A